MPSVRTVLRLIAVALGGAAGELLVLLLVNTQAPGNGFGFLGVAFPLSLLPGAGFGALDGVGFALGRLLNERHVASRRPDETRVAFYTTLVLIGAMVALGIPFGVDNAQRNAIVVSLGLPTVAAAIVAIGHGIVSGASDGLRAGFGALLGLLHGAVAGGIFGLSTSVTYLITYQPPTQPGHLGSGSAFVGFIFIPILSTGAGLALGIILAIAHIVGRGMGRAFDASADGGRDEPATGAAT